MGTKVEKSEEKFTVTIVVQKTTKTFQEDSYDRSVSKVDIEKETIADVAISGPDWESLKVKLHSHIDLV